MNQGIKTTTLDVLLLTTEMEVIVETMVSKNLNTKMNRARSHYDYLSEKLNTECNALITGVVSKADKAIDSRVLLTNNLLIEEVDSRLNELRLLGKNIKYSLETTVAELVKAEVRGLTDEIKTLTNRVTELEAQNLV